MLRRRRWAVPESRTRVQLNGVAVADDRAYAVGNRGVLLGQTEAGWDPVLTDGVAGRSRGLLDLDPTSDGRRLWVCGTRGALGSYDRETGEVHDCSTPYGLASTLRTLAVTGRAGAERVHVADDCGRIARLTVEESRSPGDRPQSDEDTATVQGVAVPGPNEPVTALRAADGMWFAADTTGRVYQSDDGREWRTNHLTAGMLTTLAVDADGLLAATRDGTVYTGIRSFSDPPNRIAPLPETARPADAAGRGHTAVLVGTDGSLLARGEGYGFERVGVRSPAGLYAVTLAQDGDVYAVGAEGVVVEGRTR